MKNFEKYNNADELEKAFNTYCTMHNGCKGCPVQIKGAGGKTSSCGTITKWAYLDYEEPKEKDKKPEDNTWFIATWPCKNVLVLDVNNDCEAGILTWMHNKLAGNDYQGFYEATEIVRGCSLLYAITPTSGEVMAFVIHRLQMSIYRWQGLYVVLGKTPLWKAQEPASKREKIRFKELMEA